MDFLPPAAAESAVPAEWVTARLDVFAEDWVTGMVGPDFESYARIFHPVDDGPDAQRWADVAELNGRIMHASAEWDRINSSPEDFGDASAFSGDPRLGNLEVPALSALCDTLAGHTSTPERCWFAVWDGWGWQHPGAFGVLRSSTSSEPLSPVESAPPAWQLDLTGPTFALPGRDYRLFGGPVAAATRVGHWVTREWFIPQSPSIIWPADHSWWVATEVDADSTLVGGSRQLITDITNSPLLEALAIARQASHFDTINV
jgi:hypothetical protein